MALFEVTIQGIAPLLHHRFSEETEASPQTRKIARQWVEPRVEAERNAYKSGKEYFFPGTAVARLLREQGASHKQRGSRRSLKYIVPAAVIVVEDAITLLNGDGKGKIKGFEVDSRPVTIPATKGRIMRHRPRFDTWSARFTLEIDETVLESPIVHQLLEEGGRRIGIGDYRPERGGPFGRFSVVSWQPIVK